MAATDPSRLEPRRFSIRLSRPLWIGVAAAVLGLIAAVLQVCMPVYRQKTISNLFDRLHVDYKTRQYGPKWFGDALLRCNWDPERLPQEIYSVKIGYDIYPHEFDPHWFASLPALEDLRLEGAWFGPTDLRFLRGSTELRELSLRGMQVTDDGMRNIACLTQLLSLDLSGTQVTDAGLTHLKSLKHLDYLRLCNTRVTNAGIKELQKNLPDVSISQECPGN